VAEKRRRQRGVYLQYLADIRMRRHLTQERLSALARVSRESIYRLEGGKRRADYRTAAPGGSRAYSECSRKNSSTDWSPPSGQTTTPMVLA
jgi:DNA-binding XRE family transcriptional regulator